MKRKDRDLRVLLGQDCWDFLEAYRRRKAGVPGDLADPIGMRKFLRDAKEIPYPKSLRKFKRVRLSRKFVRFTRSDPELRGLLHEGDNELPAHIANMIEISQRLVHRFEDNPKLRMSIYTWIGFLCILAGHDFTQMRKRDFGGAPVDAKKGLHLVAQLLRMMANGLEGKNTGPKGRFNVEHIELIRFIRSHQKKKLTPPELKQALAHAGVHISNAENLRHYEWWSRRKGLL